MSKQIINRMLGGLGFILIIIAIYYLIHLMSNSTQTSAMVSAPPTVSLVQRPLPATQPVVIAVTPPASPLQPTATAVAASPLTATLPITPVMYTYTVVNAYPHDPSAWTEGLLFDNGALYEGTGENGRSFVRKIDWQTGKILQQLSLSDQYYGEGIVIFGDKLYQLTYQTHIGFVYDKQTFALLQNFTYPTEGWGFTQDGTHLIMSDGSARLTYRDPATLQSVGHVDVSNQQGPVPQLNELEYIQGKIYANIWMTNQIVIIDPPTGKVTAYLDLTGLLPPADQAPNQWLNGIAYLPQEDRLFVTGKHWPKLFEIRLVPKQ
ncbi:MAG: glutaminyl-peptide cyclotransferase [Caldilineaceae bacterium]